MMVKIVVSPDVYALVKQRALDHQPELSPEEYVDAPLVEGGYEVELSQKTFERIQKRQKPGETLNDVMRRVVWTVDWMDEAEAQERLTADGNARVVQFKRFH